MHSQQIYDADDGSELLMARLTPEAISNTWPDLRAAIESALAPISDPMKFMKRREYILESLLSGKLMCHSFYKIINNTPYAFGVVVTSVIRSLDDGENILLIYAVYGHPKYVTGDYAEKFFGKMKEFALGVECKRIMAYSNIKEVIDAIKRLGGNADYTLLSLEVRDE